ncbi:crotonase/enoyl-CoA hydratase family protein [Sphingomonas sp. MG17]|uniref:Crotonase/enoyl-CoA hydratase family protein n=1 Tax=Sphingomonas tagetis TaxID=2949092 RepID=A0A9X2HJU9_9SPHN|nr:crotonase/enoyl-CoA hydratase family protein [Sphingomonas tagetis]MCP3731417.1 crotonase/enoyl-CoA hydratase family protein [Sphingomonas tagetis]
MAYNTIRYDVASGVATITLSRPAKLNAYNAEMMRELIHAFDAVDGDDDVRVAIVTGDGKAFCAGADISEGVDGFKVGSSNELPLPDGRIDYGSDTIRDGGGRMTLRIFEMKKPIIGAVNGPAIGIGATMLLPMDIRLASDTARFGFVFARRGIVPEGASSYFLPRIVGIGRALEWCCTGRIFDAQEALNGGLISRLYPGEQLLAAAHSLAREIADNTAPVSVALTRQMLWRGLGMTHPMEAHRIESRGVFSRSGSADGVEGVASFLEKRAAHFPDLVTRDMPDYFPWWEDEPYR